MGLKKAKLLGVKNLMIHYDSQLVTNQLIREYAVGSKIVQRQADALETLASVVE